MKIIVFNLARHKLIKICVSLLLIVTVIISTTVGISMNIYSQSLTDVYTNTLPYEKIIILDAGHGGEDPGAVAQN